MNKFKKMLFIPAFCALSLIGCGSEDKDMIFENVPNPTLYFSKNAESSQYDMEKIKGIDIKGSKEDNLEEIFLEYTENCEELNVWTEVIFIGDASWCCSTKDEKYRLAINWYEDSNSLSVCVIDQTEE